ncbi:sensor histidine kinase [Halomonas denitrificans]|nr:sensor histidine kinase [Halomonas denitrificans]
MSALERFHRWLVPPASEQGWTAYLWLVYLSFFFIEWFFRPVPAVEFALSLVTVAAFLALYFSAYRRRGPAALAHVAAIAALGVAWAPFNSGSSVLFIYAASFAHQAGRPRQTVWIVIGIAALAGLTALWAQPVLFYWLPGVFISLVIGSANIFFGEQQRRNAALRLSQAEVRRLARVAERERIARDLHDVLGHTLSLIAVKSELAGRLLDRDPDRAREEIESLGATAREALAEVREAIQGVREQDLCEALEQARLSLRSADVELELDTAEAPELPARTQAMLALIVREAVTNILRHADARRCTIRLAPNGRGGSVLEIHDDGRGTIRPDGSGVAGMRARVESLGGELELGAGRLRASIPETAR